jgi:hypothetical protein
MTDAEIVESFNLMNRLGVGGKERADWLAALTPTSAQPGGPPQKVTQEQWDQMPANERLDYCRKFAQPLEDGRRKP